MENVEVQVRAITEAVRRLCIEANTVLGEEVIHAYRAGLAEEHSPIGKEVFRQLLENARIAREEDVPLCQDTGMAVVFLEMGQDLRVVGGDLNEAVHEGVRQGYRAGYLRSSTADPLTRTPLGDNAPAVIHVEIVPGGRMRIILVPKGFGSENMSRVALFPPVVGIQGLKSFVIRTVREAGPNPCPPIIVGVGVGGTLEKAAIIAKKSLIRPLGRRNTNPEIARLEEELLEEINALGIGPQGLGGTVTALAVHIETYPTHIGSLPVAVNLQCHSCRHKEAVLPM